MGREVLGGHTPEEARAISGNGGETLDNKLIQPDRNEIFRIPPPYYIRVIRGRGGLVGRAGWLLYKVFGP